jgi:hypothetical protein
LQWPRFLKKAKVPAEVLRRKNAVVKDRELLAEFALPEWELSWSRGIETLRQTPKISASVELFALQVGKPTSTF